MRQNFNRGVTLIELIISMVLLGMVILGFFSIDSFSRQQLISADRKSRLQNEAVYVLGHMGKQLVMAIGDLNNPPVVVSYYPSGQTSFVNATIDSDRNGIRNFPNDANVTYSYNNATYAVSFSSAAVSEILARHVQSFIASYNPALNANLVTVNIITCWDPKVACGTFDNPAFSITSSIKMPSVSNQ
jgi:prepilin-type N-terminal cleavage/methylation domain-containing protein